MIICPEHLTMACSEQDGVNKHINPKWAAAEDEAATEQEGKQVDKPSPDPTSQPPSQINLKTMSK